MRPSRRALLVGTLGLGLASGCGLLGGSDAPVPVAQAWVEEARVGAGQPVLLDIQTLVEPGWTVDVSAPVAEGLTVTPGRTVVGGGMAGSDDPATETRRFRLEGPKGSYQVLVPPVKRTSPEGVEESVELGPFFVDIGVVGPSGGPLAELAEAAPAEPFMEWWEILALALGVLAGLGAVVLLRRWLRPKAEELPPPLSPAEQAARDWAAVRGQGLPDHPLAVGLSHVFRAYLEQSSGWPATRRTGPEILAWVEETGRLGPADRARAARILQATDRLKFAREGGGAEFFDSLDLDFQGILEADRLSAPELPGTPEGNSGEAAGGVVSDGVSGRQGPGAKDA